MNVKIKLYVASLAAANRLKATENTKPVVYWEHNAAIISSVSMDDVSNQCRVIALVSWPIKAGWSDHSASITEVTKYVGSTTALKTTPSSLCT